MQAVFLVFMFVLGACFGSFLCCQARRLHLKSDTSLGHRSKCLTCGQTIKWYDNIPIISWFMLRGKCRYCHTKIGLAELFSEVGLAFAFLLIGLNFIHATDIFASLTGLFITPDHLFDYLIFPVLLIFITSLGFLAIYDGLYGELPNFALIISIICAIIILILKQWSLISVSEFSLPLIFNPILSAAILGGLYLVLYLVSKGQWVGDGDWLLGLALGLALANPWFALLTLFLANALACIVSLPAIYLRSHRTTKATKPTKSPKSTKNAKTTQLSHAAKLPPLRVHLGPYLVIAFVIVYAFSDFFSTLPLSVL